MRRHFGYAGRCWSCLACFVILSLFFLAVGLTLPTVPGKVYSQKNRKMSNHPGSERGIQVASPDRVSPTEKRFALVIGNGSYQIGKLKNPPNDARAMTAALGNLNFEVAGFTNLTQVEMKQAISAFGQKLSQGGVGLFYFAGHGICVNGENYLIPVDSKILSEADVDTYGVNLNTVLRQMGNARNALNIVILDACQNNPFANRGWRDTAVGLGPVQASSGMCIAYSTLPHSVASDNPGENNSLYTQELLTALAEPGLEIEKVFKRVLSNVKEKSGGKQIPYTSQIIEGDFYFRPPVPIALPEKNAGGTLPAQETVSRLDEKKIQLASLILVASQAGTHISLNGKELGVSTVAGEKFYLSGLAADSMTITAKQYGKKEFSKTIMLQAGEKTEVVLDMPDSLPVSFENQVGIKFALIPPGEFQMGTTQGDTERFQKELKRVMGGADQGWFADELPQHTVRIRNPFYMGIYEITQSQWDAVLGYNPGQLKRSDLPVEQVSWYECQDFIRELNRRNDGYEYRLPTEAEWEYACRAGTTGDYAGDLDELTWYANNSGQTIIDAYKILKDDEKSYFLRLEQNKCQVHPVGKKKPNAFGLYDMMGNLSEWCQDAYFPTYVGAPRDETVWAPDQDEQDRVVRGGSWLLYANSCRSANRNYKPPFTRNKGIGLRLVAIPSVK